MSNFDPIKFCSINNGESNNIKRSLSTTNLDNNLIDCVNKKNESKLKKCFSENELDFKNYIFNILVRLNNVHHQKNIILKQVTFKDRVKVIFIPTKEEFKKAGLKEILWCTNEEYKKFKSDYEYRVRNYFEQSQNDRYNNTRSPVFQKSMNKKSQL